MQGSAIRKKTAVGLVVGLTGLLAAQLMLARRPGSLSWGQAGGGSLLSVPAPTGEAIPVEGWTPRFTALIEGGDWATLVRELEAIRQQSPPLYARYRLAYLHGRALLEAGEARAAQEHLRPFLEQGNPLRDLALYHSARAALREGDPAAAARLREAVVVEYPEGPYRQRTIEDQVSYLATTSDASALAAFSARLPNAGAATRDLEARSIELLASSDPDAAIERGLKLLRAGSGDDSSDRVARLLDRPEWHAKYSPETLVLLGETNRTHRHYDRAVTLLTSAHRALPARGDDLLFSIGRAQFGAEQFEAAERTYLQGAQGAKDGEARGNFLYHASRAAQLRGDDAAGESHLGAAIAAAGRSERGAVALTQRLRIRMRRKAWAEATADLRTIQKQYPKSHSVVDAVLAYATGMIAGDRPTDALRELEGVKLRLLTKSDGPEINYWRGRALERRNPEQAVQAYLKVLRASFPTHFAYLARRRFKDEPLAGHLARRNAETRTRVAGLLAHSDHEAARPLQTDLVLLSPAADQAAAMAALKGIYAAIPAYNSVLALPPPSYPKFPLWGKEGGDPLAAPDRHDLLLAMGLFDDASDLVTTRYPLHPLSTGVARSEALRRGAASRGSIYAIEVAREEVPDDFVPQILPQLIRELLYPRYFYGTIEAQAREHGADPRLVLAIMREESRFNPRAKSAAAARGLLQFIITTAQDVGRAVGLVDVEAEDLYDPEVIIKLGARYIADLSKEFGGDPYKAAAAYNAGPRQATLWARMAPAPGEDYFLTAVTFDETKDYVRKVLNSYYRYGEIYGQGEPTGGVRAEP